MWSERSVGIEGQGESVSTLKFLWKDSIYMFWVCTSGVELHSLNASVTGRVSLIYQVKNPLWEPLIANLYIWVLNPCLKTTTKTTKQFKNKCTKYPKWSMIWQLPWRLTWLLPLLKKELFLSLWKALSEKGEISISWKKYYMPLLMAFLRSKVLQKLILFFFLLATTNTN